MGLTELWRRCASARSKSASFRRDTKSQPRSWPVATPSTLADSASASPHRGRADYTCIPHHTSEVFARLARLPADDELGRAVDVLNAGRKIAILCGQGALNATDGLEQTAEILGAPIIKALLGKAAVPDSSPYNTGGIGLHGNCLLGFGRNRHLVRAPDAGQTRPDVFALGHARDYG
jgi:Thiamine pyrophosphate enzyme, central domain